MLSMELKGPRFRIQQVHSLSGTSNVSPVSELARVGVLCSIVFLLRNITLTSSFVTFILWFTATHLKQYAGIHTGQYTVHQVSYEHLLVDFDPGN